MEFHVSTKTCCQRFSKIVLNSCLTLVSTASQSVRTIKEEFVDIFQVINKNFNVIKVSEVYKLFLQAQPQLNSTSTQTKAMVRVGFYFFFVAAVFFHERFRDLRHVDKR